MSILRLSIFLFITDLLSFRQRFAIFTVMNIVCQLFAGIFPGSLAFVFQAHSRDQFNVTDGTKVYLIIKAL
jgi:hypothetical protein